MPNLWFFLGKKPIKIIAPSKVNCINKNMDFIKTTESESNYDHLEKMSVSELLRNINEEDKTIAHSVEKSIPHIEKLTEVVINKLKSGGRLFYIGAGTSGRL